MRKRKIIGWVLLGLTAAWAVFILTRSMKPAEESSEESGRLLALFQAVFPAMTDHFLRKLAHFTEFFILGALAGGSCALLLRPMLLWPLLGCALAAAADETVQLFYDGRSGEVKDALLDTLGALCALVLLWLLLWLRKNRKNK